MEAAAHNDADQTVEEGFVIKPDFLWKQEIGVWIPGTCKGQDLGPCQRQGELGSGSAACVRGGLLQGSAVPSRSEQGVRTRWDKQLEPLRPCALFHKQSPGQLRARSQTSHQDEEPLCLFRERFPAFSPGQGAP